ncbi:hypothetical protein BX600DRAFT_47829 [Xylariales sp. PMI_506]|nr:hypothetical protein BX600DRAFT_47829 [Xylariales sp. PMI_506]
MDSLKSDAVLYGEMLQDHSEELNVTIRLGPSFQPTSICEQLARVAVLFTPAQGTARGSKRGRAGTEKVSVSGLQTNSLTPVSSHSSVISTTTLDSIWYEHIKEYGHTYHIHREGKYWLPNDNDEQERLDHHYNMITKLWGKLNLAPIEAPPDSARYWNR